MNIPAIHVAAQNADVEGIRRALSAGTEADVLIPSVPDLISVTPLLRLCIASGNHDEASVVACAELLLAAGANVEASDHDGDTTLCFAAGNQSRRLVEILLDAGADPNTAGSKGFYPLHWAASRGFIEGVALLIKRGAEVNVKTDEIGAAPVRMESVTPLELALSQSHRRMYPILLRAGADCHSSHIRLLANNQTSYLDYSSPYLQKVIDAGGWAKYESLHLDKLTAMLTPKPPTDGRRRSRRRLSPLRRLPPEVLRKIVAYAFHAGYY